MLQPDDSILVPKAERINVIGKVNTPGAVAYRTGMSVLDALLDAGGVRDDANLAGATIQRGADKLPVNLDSLLRLGDIDFNLKLQPGDTLFIPEERQRVYVFGAVGRPGFYYVKPNDRILDALNEAGGMTPDADAKVVRFVRPGTDKQPTTKQVLNLDDLFHKGDISKNIPVEPGDVVYVSFRRRTLGWPDLISILGSLNLLFNGGAKLIP
jgi:polysaccharide export outer membrane protein